MSLASFVFPVGQSWERSPLIHVESLATAMVTLQFLQFVLYHVRFGASHWSVRWVAWAAYYLPMPVAVLAVATMLRFRCPPPYWLVAIFFAAGQADTMAAYSLLDGDKQSVRRFAKRALHFAYLALVLFHGDGATTTTITGLRRKEMLCLVLGLLAVLQDLKISRRAMVPPSEICKFAADHVRFQAQGRRRAASPFHEDDVDEHEPQQQQQDRPSVVAVGSLESYRSAVSGCTTLEDIRTRCSSRRLEDACLSSALFLELLQRYDGHGYSSRPPPQVAERSSANRAFTDVLAEPEGWWEWKYGRAFKLVEVQLSFMKDYFFSAHGGAPSRTSYGIYVVYSLLKISFLLTVLSLVTEEKEKPRRSTSASLYALLFLQLCQLFGYLNSDRFLVSYMCDNRGDLSGGVEAAPLSSTDDSILVRILMFLFQVLVGHKLKVYLGHYSLVEDFDRAFLMPRLMVGRLLGRRPQTQMQRGGNHVSPNNEYTVLIKKSLTSGDWSSRQFNGLKGWICDKAAADDSEPRRRSFWFDNKSMWVCDSLGSRLAWTLKQETGIHTVLIWHIATWFCDMSPEVEDVKFICLEVVSPGAYTFAMMLSRYCAYLVAKRPELLHEHPALTRSVLDQVVKEAKLCFGAGTSSEERYEMVKNWPLELMIDCSSVSRGLLHQGIKLGHQLMIYSISERWKIMADFWAEMVLFVAASGNAAAHIEHLARGDEFITQLWALLSNVWDRTSIRRNNDGDSSEFVGQGLGGILREVIEAVDKIM